MNRSTLFNNLRYALGIVLLGAAAGLVAAQAPASDAAANQLQSIDVQTLAGDYFSPAFLRRL